MKKYKVLFFYSDILSYIEIDYLCRTNTTKEKIYEELVSKGYDPDIEVVEVR